MIKPRTHWLVCLGRTNSVDLDNPNPTYTISEGELPLLGRLYELKKGPAMPIKMLGVGNYLTIDSLIGSKNVCEQRSRYFKITLKGMKTYELMYWVRMHKREVDRCRVLKDGYNEARMERG